MGVAGKGVPHTARFELGHAHRELTGLDDVRHDELVDRAAIGGRRVADGRRRGFLQRDPAGRAAAMRRRAVQVELGRMRRLRAAKAHVLRTRADVERLARADLVGRAVDDDRAWPADVDRAQLAALEKAAHRELPRELRREPDLSLHRHHAADDDAVDLAVGQAELIGKEQALDEKVAAQRRGVERLHVLAVQRLADVHGNSLGREGGKRRC